LIGGTTVPRENSLKEKEDVFEPYLTLTYTVDSCQYAG